MAGSSQADGIVALARPLAEAAGLVLESVTVTPAGKRRVLRIVVDLPAERSGGVPMEAVADVSRSFAEALDASDVMGGTAYVLEVSSPGVDRPLTERRHWMRARGRLVKLEPAAGVAGWNAAARTGRLTGVDDDGIELDGARRVPWDQLASGKVEVEFGHVEDVDLEGTGEADEPAEDDVEGQD